MRASVTPALENVTLWHRRDISHSSVERVFAADATIALDFALTRLTTLIKGWVVYPERIKANFRILGRSLFLAARFAGPDSGRYEPASSYRLVQGNAMALWHELQEGKQTASFEERIKADPTIRKLVPAAKLNACFDLRFYTRHANQVWKRVLKEKK